MIDVLVRGQIVSGLVNQIYPEMFCEIECFYNIKISEWWPI